MIDVVSVKFKGRGKTYFFDPKGLNVPAGVTVVVETSKGLELADCIQGNHTVTDERIVPPLRPVVRIATPDDMRVAELGKAREKEAFKICEEKIAEHKLDMKLVDVECNFEGNKMLFFFTSDGRVDFRELVKDLAGVFRTRIELRQIGVRDEAKMLGGLGMCGRPFCCSQFLDDFQPVSTKMAKTQSLSLNPTKISGSCGRLMCCLRYEQEAYEELVKSVPKNGAFVETPDGYGNITQTNILRQKVKVRLDGEGDSLRTYSADEVAAIPGGRPQNGETPPHILVVKPKPKPEFDDEDGRPGITVPPLFAEDTVSGDEGAQHRSGSRRRHRGGKKSKPQGSAQDKPKQPDGGRQQKPQQGGQGKPQQGDKGRQDKKSQPADKPKQGEKYGDRQGQHRGRRRHRSGGQGAHPDGQ